MINDAIDFDYAISQLLQGTNTDIYLQANVLNSDYMNKSFEQIENTLNTLYEKTRYLEDAIVYTKEFLETKINNFNAEINSVLHEIESIAETSKVKNLAYISYNVPFVENSEVLSDRDGRELNPLMLKDNKYLVLDYKLNKNIKFSTCERISNLVPHQDNLEAIKAAGQIVENKDEAYRVIYLEEKLIPEGLSETIIFYFENPVNINTLNINTSNCTVKNLKFGLVNGTEEFIAEYTIDMPIRQRQCIYIQFDLVCFNYEVIKHEIVKELVTDNIWSKSITRKYCHGRHNHTKHNHYKNECKFDKIMEIEKEYKESITIKNPQIMTAEIKEPEPQFNDSIQILNLYSYVFGINSLTINSTEFYTDGYMISDPIFIGDLKDGEYIRLDVNHNKGDCSEISYSILDEDIEIPIGIINEDFIEDELLFGEGIGTRFSRSYYYDGTYKETVKQNGMVVDISYEDAQKQALESIINATTLDENTDKKTIDRYSFTYKSNVDQYNYKPLHDTIRIKCYIRTMNNNVTNIPYISSISIRKYGEDSIWTNKY